MGLVQVKSNADMVAEEAKAAKENEELRKLKESSEQNYAHTERVLSVRLREGGPGPQRG